MAIVSKSQEGGPAGLWTRIIRVDSDGNFSSNLPEVVTQTLNYETVEGKTKKEVEEKVREALKLHEASSTVRRKVILFAVSAKYRVVDETEGFPRLVEESKGDLFDEDRHGVFLSLSAGVFEEIARITEKGRRFEYEPLKSSLQRDLFPRDLHPRDRSVQPRNLLPWTQALEDYFANTVKAMTVLAQALKGLSTPEKVLALVAKSPCALPYHQPETVNARD